MTAAVTGYFAQRSASITNAPARPLALRVLPVAALFLLRNSQTAELVFTACHMVPSLTLTCKIKVIQASRKTLQLESVDN